MREIKETNLLIVEAITSHLNKLGHPQKATDSMLRCGNSTGFEYVSLCSHDTEIRMEPDYTVL